MMTTQGYVEEQYFVALCKALLLAGAPEADIEEAVHVIMDAATDKDGVLDIDHLDALMAGWRHKDTDTPLGDEVFGG